MLYYDLDFLPAVASIICMYLSITVLSASVHRNHEIVISLFVEICDVELGMYSH